MSYVALDADLSELSAEEVDAFADAAAELDLDVTALSPSLAIDPGVPVLVSAMLGALFGKLAEDCGDAAGTKLWGLFERLFRRRAGKYAVEDVKQRVTFVWDERARQDGPAAAAAMIDIGDAIAAIPDGTQLSWDPGTGRWRWAGGDGKKRSGIPAG